MVREARVSVDDADSPGARLTLVGLRLAVSPGPEIVAERLIAPVNPARLLIVTVAVLELPACTMTEVGLEIVKSPTPTVSVVVWDRGPLLAVIVTV